MIYLLILKKLKLLFVACIFVGITLMLSPVSAAAKNFDFGNISDLSSSRTYFSPTSFNDIKKPNEDLAHVIESVTVVKPNYSYRIPILMFHHVRNLDDSLDALAKGLSVSPKSFEQDMNILKEKGYTPIFYEDINNYFSSAETMPQKPIIISFDDGYEDNFTNAFPILYKFGFKGVFAIITGMTGTSGYMNWDQIKMLKLMGNSIVSHTVTHPDLPSLNPQRAIFELSDSKRVLDNELHQNTQVIIYPAGKYSNEVISLASQIGYTIGRTTNFGEFASIDSMMSLPTIRIFDETNLSVYLK